jgi:hypothetical protein
MQAPHATTPPPLPHAPTSPWHPLLHSAFECSVAGGGVRRAAWRSSVRWLPRACPSIAPHRASSRRQTPRYLKPNPAIAIHERYFNKIFNKTIFNGVSNSFLKGWHAKAFANDFQMNFKTIFNKPIFNGVSNSVLKGWHEKTFANDFQMNFKPIFNKPIFNGVSNSVLKGWHEKASVNDFQMNFKPILNKPIFQRRFQ